MSGDSDGAGPREAVLLAVPDAVWHQAPARCRNHPQGKKHIQQHYITFEDFEVTELCLDATRAE